MFDAASLTLLVGAVLVVIGLQTRWRGLASLLGLAVVALALGASVFDGEPRIGGKFDGTGLVWMEAVFRRAYAGVVLVVLALPMARAWAPGEPAKRWWWPAVVVGVGPGLALSGSSLVLMGLMRRLLADVTMPSELRVRALAETMRVSNLILLGAAAFCLLGGAWLASRELGSSSDGGARRSTSVVAPR